MGQYQTRAASKSIDEDQSEREGGVEPEGSRIPVPSGQEVAPPLAPVFGSPIDSKQGLFISVVVGVWL